MYKNKISKSFKVIVLSLLVFGVFTNKTVAQTMPKAYRYHHLHSFGNNFSTPGKFDYAMDPRHALQMGYTMVTEGKPDDPKYDQLGLFKAHSAGPAPVRLRLNDQQKQYRYFYSYHKEYDPSANGGTGEYKSAFDDTKYVRTWINITNETIIDFIKGYGCARPEADLSRLNKDTISLNLVKELFFTGWEKVSDGSINLVMNHQSKTVVNDLAQKNC